MEEFIKRLDTAAKLQGNEAAAKIVEDWKRNKTISGSDYNRGMKILAIIADNKQRLLDKINKQVYARRRLKTAEAELERLRLLREKVAKARGKFE